MNKIHYLFIFLILLIPFALESKKEIDYGHYLFNNVPITMDTANSLHYKWDNKEILASKLIDGMESMENWELAKHADRMNIATISISSEKVFEGKSSIKFVSPTKLPVQIPTGGRYWTRENLVRKFNKQDFSEYNRISVQVYPEFKGFRKFYLTLILRNEGIVPDENVPDRYNKEGHHIFMLRNNQWNKVVMEIPHLAHDRLTGITLSYALKGNESDADDTITYYVDDLKLESVISDKYEGWDTNDEISFCHSGYNSNSKKTAFTSLFVSEGKFKLIDLSTNKIVLEKKSVKKTSNIGTFYVFDFSEIGTPGKYKIAYGDTESKPFPINKNVWLSSLEKTINLFFVERCGYDQPGIHLACHADWYTVFKGDTIEMSGGWHDAGDLSQAFASTAETTGILFKLARKYQSKNEKLSNRLIEEGLWGLHWLHKNRFEDMKVLSWTVHDHYSDGIIGNFDDTPSQPLFAESGLDGYFSVIAEVEASMALIKCDPGLSEKSMQFAIEDWNRLSGNNTNWNTALLSMAIMAGARLYELTEDSAIKNQIIDYADSLLTLQQLEPMNWSIPLSGFFYNSKGDNQLFGYPHHFPVASPVIGIVELCKLFPGHEKYQKWLNSVRLHSNYLRTIAQMTAPYYMIPANIYKTGTSEDLQVLNGVKMDRDHYLRMFPVWTFNRGNNPHILSSAIGLAATNQLLNDPELQSISQAQLEWVVGKNPFNQSLMYGEGNDFSPQYAVFTGDIVGGIPVGIQTRGNQDVPYWPAAVFHNYKEIWVHPSNRWLELLDYLDYD